MDDAALPEDPAFREAMTAYMRWAVDIVLVYSPIGSAVPANLRMPGRVGTACSPSGFPSFSKGRRPTLLEDPHLGALTVR